MRISSVAVDEAENGFWFIIASFYHDMKLQNMQILKSKKRSNTTISVCVLGLIFKSMVTHLNGDLFRKAKN